MAKEGMAEAYREHHPGLRIEYAIDLTYFDPELLEWREVSEECPDGVIQDEYFACMLGRYERMQSNLKVMVGCLDPNDTEALSDSIGKTEQYPY